MYWSFFKVALRILWRQKNYTLINTIGLTISIGSAILIFLFVLEELQYDTFHANAKNIYRMYLDGKIGEERIQSAHTCAPLGPTLKREYPEIVDVVRIKHSDNVLIKTDKKSLLENYVLYADSGFFTMLTFPLIKGNPATVLSEPYSTVLTQSTAFRIFGNEDPFGKLIRFENDTNLYTVTGIAADPPWNSQYRFHIVVPFNSIKYENITSWINNSYYTYVQLAKGSSPSDLENKIHEMLKKYVGPEIKLIAGVELEDWYRAGNSLGYKLQPLLKVHLDNTIQGGIIPSANRKYLIIFSFIAAFIIIIACINYMNMATARSVVRAKEVEIRKIVGADRKMLVFQFITESTVISIISLVLAVLLIDLAIPWFNNTMQLTISLNILKKFPFWTILILSAIVIGILAGLYPAFLLSTYSPERVLKSNTSYRKGNTYFRRSLVTFQFIISISILSSTMIIYRQLKYIQSKDPGFDKENLLVIERGGTLGKNLQVFLEEIEKLPCVMDASISTALPGRLNSHINYGMEGREQTSSYLMYTFWTDENFAKTFKLKIREGRYFSHDYPSDYEAAVINETALKQFSIQDFEKTRFILPGLNGNNKFIQVIGVVNDFNIESLHSEIKPSVFMLQPKNWNWGYVSVRLIRNNIHNSISSIESIWNKMTGNEPFQFFFIDDELNNQYREERRTGNLAFFFTILAISIACLGLMGLVSFTIERRTKEICIRKIMGIKPLSIVFMLSSETLILVFIASLIAWPITWFYMNNWLAGFAYRISLNPVILIYSTLIVVFVSMITILWQAFRASTINPADALRYE